MSKEGIEISNLEMNKFNKNGSNAEIKGNFAGVYPLDKIVVFLFLSTFTI